MAAVLAGGPSALLGGRAAAAHWGLLTTTPTRTDVLTRRSVDGRPGIRFHRVRALPAQDRATRDGVPCTSVARTLLDLAPQVGDRALDRMLRRALDLRLFDRRAFDDILARGRRGTVVLRDAVAALSRDTQAEIHTKSELEQRFLTLLRRHGFVLPRTNVVVHTPWGSYEVDTLWPDRGPGTRPLVIELDGWNTHHDRESFRRDHRRDADLTASGHDRMRLTWEQTVDREAETVTRLDRIIPRRA